MDIIHTQAELRSLMQTWRSQSCTTALVPTMGNLHAGHLRLVAYAKNHSDRQVVSIFVNPTQFAAGEDLDNYPRSFERDCEQLKHAGVDVVFAPDNDEIYSSTRERQTRVHVPELADKFCGASRPGHFDGVTTIVAKLFNLVQPQLAVFGEKDYQQLFLIRKMVTDLNFPVKIHGIATERAADGLALSSRNSYLTEVERARAPRLYAALQQAASELQEGEKDFKKIEKNVVKILEKDKFIVDYVHILRTIDLQPASQSDQNLVILVAASLGQARLIDNISIQLSDTI
jgi:pantoate--beta-alanine ligase